MAEPAFVSCTYGCLANFYTTRESLQCTVKSTQRIFEKSGRGVPAVVAMSTWGGTWQTGGLVALALGGDIECDSSHINGDVHKCC